MIIPKYAKNLKIILKTNIHTNAWTYKYYLNRIIFLHKSTISTPISLPYRLHILNLNNKLLLTYDKELVQL